MHNIAFLVIARPPTLLPDIVVVVRPLAHLGSVG